jgi:hypothetical protein
MRKIGLPCLIFSAVATSAPAAVASSLYSASISGTSYLRSRSEKIGSIFRLLLMIFLPIAKERKVSSKERGIPSAKRTRRILTTRSPFVSPSCLAAVASALTISFRSRGPSACGQERAYPPQNRSVL